MSNMKNLKVLILNLPSPPGMDVNRDYSGGYGTAHLVNRKDYGHSSNIVFPVFMPYLATKIKSEGYELKILDAKANRLNSESTIREVKNEQPKFVISMLSLPSLYGDIHLLNKIKEKFPETFLIGVGAVCKFLAEEILENSKVDFLINGEYPFYSTPIIKLLHALEKESIPSVKNIPGLIYREKQKRKILIKKNPIQRSQIDESLDDLDVEIYSEFPLEKYKLWFFDSRGKPLNYFPILSGKGCPFTCIYCPYPIGFGKKIFYKSPANLVNEMEFLNKNFEIKAFVFRDQVFTADKERVEKICDLITERSLKIDWLFETRVDKISKNLLRKLKNAGCNRIHYGVETGDKDLLMSMGKPGVSVETILMTFRHTAEAGIYSMAHVIIGLPGENRETVQRTYDLLVAIQPDGVSWNIATPYPGTKLFEIAKEKSLILTYDWQRYNTCDIVMRTEELSARDLRDVARKLATRFRMRQIVMHGWRAMRSRRELTYLVKRAAHEIRRVTKT